MLRLITTPMQRRSSVSLRIYSRKDWLLRIHELFNVCWFDPKSQRVPFFNENVQLEKNFARYDRVCKIARTDGDATSELRSDLIIAEGFFSSILNEIRDAVNNTHVPIAVIIDPDDWTCIWTCTYTGTMSQGSQTTRVYCRPSSEILTGGESLLLHVPRFSGTLFLLQGERAFRLESWFESKEAEH